jgi:peptide/nickel transport system substrate-binding protein
MALNISSPSSDVGIMARYFSSANFAPNGFNFEQWKDDEFDDALKTIAEATDPKAITAAYRKAHERLVDNPPGSISSTISTRARCRRRSRVSFRHSHGSSI